MANQTTEENAKPRTGLNRIADELHQRFCGGYHPVFTQRVPAEQMCWYYMANSIFAVAERYKWWQIAKEVSDIVREELVR